MHTLHVLILKYVVVNSLFILKSLELKKVMFIVVTFHMQNATGALK